MSQTPAVHASDELAEHLLGDIQVSDHTVAQRPAGGNRGRRATDHPLGLVTDRQHPAGPGVLCHHGRLGYQYPPATGVHERVRGTEVDREVASAANAHMPSPGQLASKR